MHPGILFFSSRKISGGPTCCESEKSPQERNTLLEIRIKDKFDRFLTFIGQVIGTFFDVCCQDTSQSCNAEIISISFKKTLHFFIHLSLGERFTSPIEEDFGIISVEFFREDILPKIFDVYIHYIGRVDNLNREGVKSDIQNNTHLIVIGLRCFEGGR